MEYTTKEINDKDFYRIPCLPAIEETKTTKYFLSNKDGIPLFVLVAKDDTEYCVEFELYEVTGWLENNVVNSVSLYITGTIKWDGCSHIYFGEMIDGKQDGYLHLCGKHSWDMHIAAMSAVYKLAENIISGFDKSVAGN